jgi:hypothetical protein
VARLQMTLRLFPSRFFVLNEVVSTTALPV